MDSVSLSLPCVSFPYAAHPFTPLSGAATSLTLSEEGSGAEGVMTPQESKGAQAAGKALRWEVQLGFLNRQRSQSSTAPITRSPSHTSYFPSPQSSGSLSPPCVQSYVQLPPLVEVSFETSLLGEGEKVNSRRCLSSKGTKMDTLSS